MAVKIYKRSEPKWWMEEGEKQEVAKRLKEEYAGLKVGSDGRNVPSVTKQYAKAGSGIDASALGVEKLSISEKLHRMMSEGFGDLDGGMDDGMNAEPEVPVDAEMGDEGEVEPDAAIEDETGADVDDITICIGDQEYTLVPVAAEEGGEGVEGEELDDMEGGDEGDLGDEGLEAEGEEEEEDLVEARKAKLRKKVQEALKVAQAKKAATLKEKAPVAKAKVPAKRVKEADDLYDWSADIGGDEDVANWDSANVEDNFDADFVEAKKANRRRVEAIRKRLAAKKEEIDNLGGKKLAFKQGKESDIGGGDYEFDAPKTQGNASKAAAIKTSPSTGRYGEEKVKPNTKVVEFRKKLEAIKAKKDRAALEEEEKGNDQENWEIDDGGYEPTFPLELGADPNMIERYRKIKARRAERAERADAPIQEGTKKQLDFGKLLREGFGKDSRAEVQE